jgi:hypothetical protein
MREYKLFLQNGGSFLPGMGNLIRGIPNTAEAISFYALASVSKQIDGIDGRSTGQPRRIIPLGSCPVN